MTNANRSARPGFYFAAHGGSVIEVPLSVPHIRCRDAAGCPACEAREADERAKRAARAVWEAERAAERAELAAARAAWNALPERAALLDRVLP